MTDDMKKSPEQWEAVDMIDELKQGMPPAGHPAKTDLCRAHTHALIWIIRRIDLNGKKSAKAEEKNDSMPWWKISKEGVQMHAPALVLFAAFALLIGAYVYVHGKTVEKNAAVIAVAASDEQTKFVRATIEEVRREWRENHK